MHVRRTTFLVFVLFLGLYVLTASGHLYSPDEELMFRVTESIATRGELAVEPLQDIGGGTFASRKGKDGREYAQYGILNSFAAVPLYWIGDGLTRIIPSDAAEEALDFRTTSNAPGGPDRGHHMLRRFAVSFFGAIVAAAICALLWRTIRTRFWRAGIPEADAARCAWIGAIAFGAGTMALPHARTFFSEPLATFFILASLHILTGGQHLKLSRIFWGATMFALALATRLDSLFVAPAIVLPVMLRTLEEDAGALGEAFARPTRDALAPLFTGGFVTRCMVFAIPIIAFGVYQILLNSMLFGSATSSGYADQKEGINFSTPMLAGLYGFLFSAGKSVFLFSPILFLVIAGTAPSHRRVPVLAISSLAVIVFALIVHSKWQNWSGGFDWGPRHIYKIHPFACILVAGFAISWSRIRRMVFLGFMLLAFAVQLYGASQNPVDFYMLYFRTPYNPPNAYALYAPSDMAQMITRLEVRYPDGKWEPPPAWVMFAPMNDSIYVPQNTPWYRYAEMWRLGYRDNLWLRLLKRATANERPVG